jgi:predicted nucleic acid-binding protein
VLHVASAIHLGVTDFLTFDGNQKELAEAEGLVVPV